MLLPPSFLRISEVDLMFSINVHIKKFIAFVYFNHF